ncbi:hypothetical protein ACVOMV_22100 [Mesorhizobium atlanticum]
MEIRNEQVSASQAGMTCTRTGALAAAVTAPSRNWPSPPKFHMPARKATIRPAARNKSGAMRVSVCWMPSGENNPFSST